MALPTTNYGNSPFQPGVTQDAFIPDQLIGGDLKVVTHGQRTLTGGQLYRRGTVLGRITASGKYTIATSAANDGSQNPVAILVDDTDTTAGDAICGIYARGEFNKAAVILGAGITADAAQTALEPFNIYLKTPVSAADPT